MRPNLSKVTSPSVREVLLRSPYRAKGNSSKEVDNLKLLPLMVEVFYGLCERLGRPPRQDEYTRSYLVDCTTPEVRELLQSSQIGDWKSKWKVEDVGRRLSKAWASFMGELDFYCRLRDSGLFDAVEYDTELDTKAKVDIAVVYRGQKFYVQLYYYYDTTKERADSWLKKEEERKARDGVQLPAWQVVSLPLTEADADTVGNLHLYNEEHVKRLEEILLERLPPAKATSSEEKTDRSLADFM